MALKNLAVITTGGDAPGMNAAIRAVVRTAITKGFSVFGVERGWEGLIEGAIQPMGLGDVGGILNRGGTALRTSRNREFKTNAGRKKAALELRQRGIEYMVVIGGDGSMRAASIFRSETGLAINLVPASIDNDVGGTDYSVGFDTAVNTAVEAIDKIRDTATSHERLFIVQVMGREHGFIAIEVGLACGAEAILIPEISFNPKRIAEQLKQGRARGKKSSVIVMAEGAGDVNQFAKTISKLSGLDVRVSVLGHIQRGGSPTAFSRLLAARLGAEAVNTLAQGKSGYLVGWINQKVVLTPFASALKQKRPIDVASHKLAALLAK